MSPEERTERAKLAAEMSWAKTPDRTVRTEAARRAKERRYFDQAREMRPDATEEEIAQIASHLQKAAMAKMRLARATNQRKKAEQSAKQSAA